MLQAKRLNYSVDTFNKPKVVLAKSKQPLNVQIVRDIRDMFLGGGNKSGKLALELGSLMRIKYKMVDWKLEKINLNSDSSSETLFKPEGRVQASGYKGAPFAEHRHIFSDRLILIIRDALHFNMKGKGSVDLELWVRFNPEETREICGNTKVPELFMLATAFNTLASSTLTNMTFYTDPKSLKTRGKNQKTNIYVRLNTGRLLYLPAVDTRDKITKELRQSFNPNTLSFDASKQTFKHDIIYWNLEVGELKYISSNGQQMSFPIGGSIEPSRSAAFSILKSKWSEIIIKLGVNEEDSLFGSLSKFISSKYPNETAFSSSVLHSETQRDFIRESILYFEQEKAKKFLGDWAKWLRTIEASNYFMHPLRRYSVLAVVSMMNDWCGKVDDLEKEIQDKIGAMQNATISDMPVLPGNFRDDLELYPHQADVAAKTNLADETLGLDVSTGGGKTLLLLVHILKEMQKANIIRPIIVMPVNLIKQWFDEIHYFTKSSVNVIPITTESIRTWTLEKIADLIKSAPQNTIYLSTYDWVSGAGTSQVIRGKKVWSFPRVEFLKQFNFDAVFIDESHRIKNAKSATHQALIQMGYTATRRGIATGTITPNKQSDIVGQMTFLDPALFGTKDDFEKEFLKNKKTGEFHEGAEEVIQERLRSVGVVTKTRKDWFYVLPKINDNFHIVQMSKNQKEKYDSLINDTLSSFEMDPTMVKAWLDFQQDPESERIPAQFIARLAMIETYASDPGSSPFGIEGLLTGDDLISPKLPKILEILQKHFSKTPDEKVLIFSQYQAKIIDHIYSNLGPFKAMAKLYRGGMIKNLDAFKKDPEVKILVACSPSISEGHNLQMASRMIRLNSPWAPGTLDQEIARIYRLLKGSEREYVNIDWILTDMTIDVLKFRRTIRKLVINSTMMGIVPVNAIPQRPIISVNPVNLQFAVSWNQALQDEVHDYKRYRDLEKEAWEELRKTQPLDFVKIKTGDPIPGKIINTPIPDGASIPNGENKTTAVNALDDWAEGDPKNLLGHRCNTEFGGGFIRSATMTKGGALRLGIEFDDEDLESTALNGSSVEVLEDVDPNYGQKKVDISIPGTDIEIGGSVFWLTPEGLLHKTRKVKGVNVLGKIKFVFDGYDWLTPTGRKSSKVTPKIDKGLRKALQKLGYKFPKDTAPSPAPEKVYKFKKTEDKIKKLFYMRPNGDIGILNEKTGKELKPHIQLIDDEWIYTKGIKKGKSAFPVALELKLKKKLKDLGYEESKEIIVPKAPPMQKQAPPVVPTEVKKPFEKALEEGYKFKMGGFLRLLKSDGIIYKIKPRTQELTIRYLFDEENQCWTTATGKPVKFTPAETKQLLIKLDEVRSTNKRQKALKKLKTKKTEAPPAIESPPSVSAKAVNFGGVPVIGIFYTEPSRENELQLALKSQKFYSFNVLRLYPMTAVKITRLKKELGKTLKPKNLEELSSILDNWRKAELHMKNYSKAKVKEFKQVMRQRWKSLDLYIQPTIVDGELEIWIPAMKPRTIKRLLPILRKLKFSEEQIFLRHFLIPSGILQGATYLLNTLKAKKIELLNLKEFKQGVRAIKKRVK